MQSRTFKLGKLRCKATLDEGDDGRKYVHIAMSARDLVATKGEISAEKYLQEAKTYIKEALSKLGWMNLRLYPDPPHSLRD